MHLIQNLWDTVTQSIVGAGTAVVGTGALAATIVAIPVSYGAAALALIPAVAGFSVAAVASIDSLVSAAKSAGATGMSIYYLARSADDHPINQMLAIAPPKDNLLSIMNSKYLKDKNGELVLKSKLKGPDSWHLIQFLESLFIHAKGAFSLQEELKENAANEISILLRALYRAHSVKQDNLDKAICAHTIALTQILQEQYGWNILKRPDLNLVSATREDNSQVYSKFWISAYQEESWLPVNKETQAVKARYKERLNDYLFQYYQQIRAEQPGLSVYVPWSFWYKDEAIEHLRAIYREYKNDEEAPHQILENAYLAVISNLPLAKEYAEQEGSTPIYSSWGLELAEKELNKTRQHISSQALDSNNELKLKTLEDKMEKAKDSVKEKGSRDYRVNLTRTFNEQVDGNVGLNLANSKNLPSDLETLREQNRHDEKIIKMGIKSTITANKKVGSGEDNLFNRDYAVLANQDIQPDVKASEVNSDQPNLLTQLGLFSPRGEKLINVRRFLIMAGQYHESLKEEDNKHIVAVREELKELLDACPENVKEITKAQRDEIRDKIQEIDEVKAAICKPG